MIKLGIDQLINQSEIQKRLLGKRIGLVAHPASINNKGKHAIDILKSDGKLNITCAFGPQHGMRGEKQDNMIESEDFIDPVHKIPVFSLYGEFRRPTPKMLDHCDVVIFDLQDVGCRIYTFLTTLFYILEDCSLSGKEVWVLDRPNPAGRAIEGILLDPNYFSFVGAATLPMRHGLTLGEAANWYVKSKKLNVELNIVKMEDYKINCSPTFGWDSDLLWVNPSPNMPKLSTVRDYCGTVLIEGTHLSEGRGTTTPLEVIGMPNLKVDEIIRWMRTQSEKLFEGFLLRSCFFEPTFHKFSHQLCSGIFMHGDDLVYSPNQFKPFRFVSLFLKGVSKFHPEFEIFKQPPYEYETVKMPFDILSGSDFLRKWILNPNSQFIELENKLNEDEKKWFEESREFYLY